MSNLAFGGSGQLLKKSLFDLSTPKTVNSKMVTLGPKLAHLMYKNWSAQGPKMVRFLKNLVDLKKHLMLPTYQKQAQICAEGCEGDNFTHSY